MTSESNVSTTNYQSAYTDIYLGKQNAAARYNTAISNPFELYIWELEKHFLDEIFGSMGDTLQLEYMDYACGTGRIVNHIAEKFRFRRIVGADSSAEMLEAAQSDAPEEVGFVQMNLANAHVIDDKFDIISAFRLFLNLEDENRRHILSGIHQVLRENGVLVVNNHMNRYSFKGLVAFIMRHVFGVPLKHQRKPGQRSVINTMSEREFRRLLQEAGFAIEKVYRFALLPGHKGFLPLSQGLLIPLELFLSKIPLLNFIAKDQIYVCRRITQ